MCSTEQAAEIQSEVCCAGNQFFKTGTRCIRKEDFFIIDNEKSGITVRNAGKYRGIIQMTEDFDEPLDEFREYM